MITYKWMSLHTNYVKLTAGISGDLLIPVKLSTMSWHIWESTMSWHLSDTDLINENQFKNLHADCKELVAMLVATVKTSRARK